MLANFFLFFFATTRPYYKSIFIAVVKLKWNLSKGLSTKCIPKIFVLPFLVFQISFFVSPFSLTHLVGVAQSVRHRYLDTPLQQCYTWFMNDPQSLCSSCRSTDKFFFNFICHSWVGFISVNIKFRFYLSCLLDFRLNSFLEAYRPNDRFRTWPLRLIACIHRQNNCCC